MPSRDPNLTIAISRFGWVAGHRRYRLARLHLQIRKCGVIVLLLAAMTCAVYLLFWGPEHANDTAEPTANVERAQGGKAHSNWEAADLCHGANVAPAAARLPTMINAVFQGKA